MKITRTAPNEFNICELSSDELVAILSCIDCLVHPEHEALPADFLQNLHRNLCSEREKLVKRERLKKRLS